jgi:hypothetical protein
MVLISMLIISWLLIPSSLQSDYTILLTTAPRSVVFRVLLCSTSIHLISHLPYSISTELYYSILSSSIFYHRALLYQPLLSLSLRSAQPSPGCSVPHPIPPPSFTLLPGGVTSRPRPSIPSIDLACTEHSRFRSRGETPSSTARVMVSLEGSILWG